MRIHAQRQRHACHMRWWLAAAHTVYLRKASQQCGSYMGGWDTRKFLFISIWGSLIHRYASAGSHMLYVKLGWRLFFWCASLHIMDTVKNEWGPWNTTRNRTGRESRIPLVQREEKSYFWVQIPFKPRTERSFFMKTKWMIAFILMLLLQAPLQCHREGFV